MACALLLVGSAPAWAEVELAEPLDVPRGAGLRPETGAQLPLAERVSLAERDYRRRGYADLPVLAWALLEDSAAGDFKAAERAVSLAPHDPGVHFEAARRMNSPWELFQALATLTTSFPGVLWAIAVGGATLGLGALLAAFCVIAIGFVRSLGLHGHALGHLTSPSDPPVWPGAVLVLASLALVPLAGVGPAALLAAAGALAAMRARKRTSVAVAVALAVSGVILGPGLDYWSRAAVLHGRDTAVAVAWRADRAQPLPGDYVRLEQAVARDPADMLARIGLASLALHRGDLDAADSALEAHPNAGTADMHAQAANLRGIVHVARGDVDAAIAAFEDSRSLRLTAAVLYNTSQAYARGMRLLERSGPFSAARDLDPELVGEYTAFEGKNVHQFLIRGELPLRSYLQTAFMPSPEAAELAYGLRLDALGPRAPDWAWMALPVLGILGLSMRRSGIHRCTRCERPVCERCAPDGGTNSTCVRCAKLFARGSRSDPRVRKLQLDLDRKRQSRAARTRAGLSLVLPGAARVLDGGVAAGAFALAMVGTGAALFVAPALFPVPFELGALGDAIPRVVGWTLLGAAYAWGLVDSAKQLRGRRVRT